LIKSAPATMADSPLRVGIFQRLDQPGGVQSVVLSLIKGLNQRQITPDILWDVPPSQRMLAEKGLQAGYCPVRLPISTRLIDRCPITVRHILRSGNMLRSDQIPEKYDFYYIFYNGFLVTDGTPHIRYLSGPPLLPQLDTAPDGLRGVPIRSFRWAYHKGLYRILPFYIFHRDSHYVINSHFTAELFEEAHGTRLPVVHPPIDLSGRDFSAEDLSQRDTITYFSRFVDYKRPEILLELATRYPEQRFLLMGGVKPENRAFYESLKQKLKTSGVKNTELLDNPSDERVRAELARTRFYVFPAINEHFGMATAEAIGSGAIPYVHDSGGQREIVPDTRLRFSDEEFYDKFSALLQLPEAELNHLRQGLRKHVQRFSEEAFIEKMLSFIGPPLERQITNEFQAAKV
jgi:glycosyltransferase involved in cell wall biosynthesis